MATLAQGKGSVKDIQAHLRHVSSSHLSFREHLGEEFNADDVEAAAVHIQSTADSYLPTSYCFAFSWSSS